MDGEAEQLEFKHELFKKLDRRGKGFLVDFYEHLEGKDIREEAHTAKVLAKNIASKYEEKVEEFYEDYELLKENNIKKNAVVEYLNRNHDIDREELEVEGRFELLLLLYKKEVNGELEKIIKIAKVVEHSRKDNYFIDETLDLNDLDERLDEFHEYWNKKKKELYPLRVKSQVEDREAILEFYMEYGGRSFEQFKFREDKGEDLPAKPEPRRHSHHPLKKLRLAIRPEEGQTEIIFTDSYSGWKEVLEELFSFIFGVSNFFENIKIKKSTVAEEIETTGKELYRESDEATNELSQDIEEKKETAIKLVEDKSWPENERDDIKQRIESIRLAGPHISDDENIQVDEFQMIAELVDFLETVDGMKTAFKDLVRKADEENMDLNLKIQNKAVKINDGQWNAVGNTRLGKKNRRALEVFFEGEEEIETDDN